MLRTALKQSVSFSDTKRSTCAHPKGTDAIRLDTVVQNLEAVLALRLHRCLEGVDCSTVSVIFKSGDSRGLTRNENHAEQSSS